MKAGKMDRRITVQHRVVTGKESNGEDLFNWVEVVECWAEFVANSGQEKFSAHQKRAFASCMFRMRFYPGITEEMRLIYKGLIHDIVDVAEMRGRNSGLEIFTIQGLTDG